MPGRDISFFQKITTILAGLLLILSLNLASAKGNNDAIKLAQKANLALRRTAHQLMILNGDSTSTIPPVKQIDSNTFSVEVPRLFQYEKLPELLAQSLAIYQIKRPYDVAVYNCETGQLQLGYHFLDLEQKGGVPCEERNIAAGCYIVQLSFIGETAEAASSANIWWVFPFSGLLIGIGFMVVKKLWVKATVAYLGDEKTENKLQIGNSHWDLLNQTLIAGKATHQLTFREAKLLNLFINHPNQVLERDYILKSVWEDEGVTVSRSVDVFVSRLRKMLSDDPSLKLTAVHGVGYRFEIHS